MRLATRIGMGAYGLLAGLALGGASAHVLGGTGVRSPVVEVVALAITAALLLRGCFVSLRLGPRDLVARNLLRTRRVPVERMEAVAMLRHAGLLMASTPAVAIEGRRLRVPLYAATMWGGWWSGANTAHDDRIVTTLRDWARQHNIAVRPDFG